MSVQNRIADLAQLLEGTGIATLELVTPDEAIHLRRNPGAIPAVLHAAPTANAAGVSSATAPDVTAPCPGIVRHRHPLRDAPLVSVGQWVEPGATLVLLQVGPLLIPVSAPAAGRVAQVLVPDGAVVGYGTPLVRLDGKA